MKVLLSRLVRPAGDGHGRRWRAIWPVASVALLLALPAVASAAPITGTAFEDFNDNGARNATPMVDAGVGGITVTAYRADGTQVAATQTAADGSYTLDVPAGTEVRVEFTNLPPGYQPARHGANSGTTVQFVTGPAANVDVGVLEPTNYCQNNPQLALACMHFGAHDTGEHAGDAAIRLVSDGTADNMTPSTAGLGTQVAAATFGQVGSVFGVAQATGSDFLYSSAFTKRHADWGPGGPGAIYRTDVDQANAGTPNATVFFDVNELAGAPAGTATREIGGWVNDAGAWNAVGNTGLGNLTTNLDGSELFTVGLATGQLIRIPVPGDGSSPDAGSVDAYPVPSPCAPAGDARPMGVGYNDGLVYVGGVCSRASAGNPPPQPGTGLSVYVYTFDPATGTFSAAPVLDTPLPADRLCTLRAGAPIAPFPVDNCPGSSADWHPWTSQVLKLGTYPQPMLSDIEFVDGDLVLGIRDRWADQLGWFAAWPDGTGGEAGTQSGYNLRACPSGGVYQLESNGTCGGLTASGQKNVAAWGPGGSLFYWDQDYNHNPAVPQGAHDYTGLGGLLTLPGYPELRMSVQDAADECPPGMITNACPSAEGPNSSGGVLYLSQTNGSRVKGYNVYTAPLEATATFGKSNGLGDLEALCDAAPIEIGNYVWLDPDRDGIQDAGERKLGGVTVQLMDAGGNVIATTTTASNGQYFFNETNVPAAIQPNTAYTVRIPLDQPVLAAFLPTRPDANAQLRDSDGITAGRFVVDRLTTGAAGHNDHTHDFGFYARTSNFTFTKTSSRQRVRVGNQLTYTLTATNTGPDAALPGAVVRDTVPSRFRVVRVTPGTGATCDVDGREVRCTLAAMAVGQAIEVKIRVRAMRAGGTVNVAYLVPTPGTCCTPPPPEEPVRIIEPELGLTKGVNKKTLVAGQKVTYTIRVRNPSNATLRNVRTCDDLPTGLAYVSSKRRAKLSKGQYCWTEKRLGAGQRKTYKLTARALQGIRPGKKVNRATAKSPDARTKRAKRAVRVKAGDLLGAGGVTG